MTSETDKQSSYGFVRLQNVTKLIENYDGKLPFHLYLKKQFAKQRNFGSRDRKLYTSWCFAWFRLGNAISGEDFITRLSVANFLVNGVDNFPYEIACQKLIHGLSNDKEVLDLKFRIKWVESLFMDFKISDIFPFDLSLSGNLNRKDYSISMLTQPMVFIRLSGIDDDFVKEELSKEQISYILENEFPQALCFPPAVNLLKLKSYEKGLFEIQDRSSQIAGNAIPVKDYEQWWDCCCGAGGKALQLLSVMPSLKLTVSDKRISILENFINRLSKYPKMGIDFKEMDLEEPVDERMSGNIFDGIIADVPCSGSGTWARSPEWLRYFNPESLLEYTTRQKTILDNVLPLLKPGGTLVYITCSVFKAENEEISDWLNSKSGIQRERQFFIDGIYTGSDSMYYAFFKIAHPSI